MASDRLRDLFFAAGLFGMAVAALTLWREHLVPIAVAVLIWFLINAMAGALRRAAPWLPRSAATLAAIATMTAAAVTVAQGVGGAVAEFAPSYESAQDALAELIQRGMEAAGPLGRFDFEGLVGMLNLPGIARGLFDAARGLAGDVSLVLLYVMFLLLDQRFYDAKLQALVPDPIRRARLEATLARVAEDVRVYLWLMTVVSAGVGAATWAICLGFGLDGAAFWGFLAFGLNFIPVIGTILGVAAPSLFALTQLPDLASLAAFVAALAAVQFTAGEIALPRLMGERLNLAGFVILLTLVVWGAMWGPAGMFLAVPITVIAALVCAQFERTRFVAVLLSKTGRPPERTG